jgi:cation diffusion facilitator CzcD-associated flavoprotein CzcO
VLAAAWDHARRRWQVNTNRGGLTCDVLITATGPLSEPKIPNLPRLETFQGKVSRSARCDLDDDLRNRRAAVVCTAPGSPR